MYIHVCIYICVHVCVITDADADSKDALRVRAYLQFNSCIYVL